LIRGFSGLCLLNYFTSDLSVPVYLLWTGPVYKLQMSKKSGTSGNFNCFLIFIYRLKFKVKRLKMALRLDERVEIVLLSGHQGWCLLLKSDIFITLGRITDCCATLGPNMLSKICTNMVKRLKKCVECRGEHIEHIM
jgi:hypothetical protein